MVLAWLLVVGLAVIGAPPRITSNATPTRAVELLIGALLAIFVATPSLSGALPKVRAVSPVSIAGVLAGLGLLAMLAVTGTSESVNFIIGWPLISILTCTVIYACLRAATPVTAPLGTRFMTGVGKRSYGLYLWHFPIFVAIDTRWGLGPLGREAGCDRDHRGRRDALLPLHRAPVPGAQGPAAAHGEPCPDGRSRARAANLRRDARAGRRPVLGRPGPGSRRR